MKKSFILGARLLHGFSKCLQFFTNIHFWTPFGYFDWDTCSWKGQLERTRSWKVLSWKVWSWKVCRSWKEPSEVGKNPAKLERTQRSWKVFFLSWKVSLKLESFAEVGKFRCSWKVLAEVGKYEWTWKVVTEVRKLWLKLCQKWFLHFIY